VSEHPAKEELFRFMKGQLRREEVTSLVRHLDDCAQCQDAAAANEQVVRSVAALEADLLGSAEKTAPPAARAVRESLRWPLAAAAAAAAALIGMSAFMARTPSLPPQQQASARPALRASKPAAAPAGRYARPEWSTAVDDAIRDGTLALPSALADLQLAADPERAPAESRAQWLAPAAAIVDTARPEFRWTAARGASYVVSIFEDQKVVVESAVLHEPRWLPDRDLRPGRVYHWQVEVSQGGETNILPAPPAPPAFFRVLDAASHEELELARTAHGNDHLLLGVLYARKGLRAEAARELARVKTPEGRRFLKSVQAWSGAENPR
jgi:hypothetical protein